VYIYFFFFFNRIVYKVESDHFQLVECIIEFVWPSVDSNKTKALNRNIYYQSTGIRIYLNKMIQNTCLMMGHMPLFIDF
jgi:hypothetical protein